MPSDIAAEKEDEMPKTKSAPIRGRDDRSFTQVVAENLRRVRAVRGWSQEQLRAELEGLGHKVSRATVAAYETGTRAIEVSDLFALAVALGVAPTLLLYPPAGWTVRIYLTPDPRYGTYLGRDLADWLWDPDGHPMSDAGVSEWTTWFESAGMGDRVSPEDLKDLSRKVRRDEGEGETSS